MAFAAGPAGAGAGACISSLVGGGRALARDGRAAGRDQTYRKSYTFVFMNTAVFSVCSLEAVIRG